MTLEWVQVSIGLLGLAIGAVSGLIAGVWRVARIEHDVRNDLRQEIAEAVHEMAEKIISIAEAFDETLKGLRQKINDVELQGHKSFVSKSDFSEFREEYRDDMRDLKNSIAELRKLPRSAA